MTYTKHKPIPSPAASIWRPFSEAPKDGSFVLGVEACNEYTLVHYREGLGWVDDHDNGLSAVLFTHFALINPPEDEE